MKCKSALGKIEPVCLGYIAVMYLLCMFGASVAIVANYWGGAAGYALAAGLNSLHLALMIRDERKPQTINDDTDEWVRSF